MNIKHHKILVERTAHIYTIGELSVNTKYIWLVCHGYAQLASRIIRKFSVLDPQEHFIIAPEGLSKFYWKGVTGDVAASWMTKENRLDEIQDYSNYLSSVYSQYIPAEGDFKVIFFGFSQGASTVWRWMYNHKPMFHKFIIWAGWIPEDLKYIDHLEYLKDKEIYYHIGSQDIYLTDDRIKFIKEFSDSEKLKINWTNYDGKHEIDREELLSYFRKYIH